MTRIWRQKGDELYLELPATEHVKLDNAVYTIGVNPNTGQFFLKKKADEYTFNYKIYNLENGFHNRVVRSWKAKGTGNMGVLLNGVKGTGKTVTAKIISNQLDQPVVLVDVAFKGLQRFINSIPQDITVFIDEYEKIYEKSTEMLSIMDGSLNSEHRRMFLLTTNKHYIDTNMIERPSRIRYVKEYGHLSPSIVEEIIDDCLEQKHHRQACISFMSLLKTITVDIVKEVLNEVNIHDEAPEEFADIFNIKKNDGRCRIFEVQKDGSTVQVMNNAEFYPRPDWTPDHEGSSVELNGRYIGKIVQVKGPKEAIVGVYENTKSRKFKETIHIMVEESYSAHYNYAWGDDGENSNRVTTSESFLSKIEVPRPNSNQDQSESSPKIGNAISIENLTRNSGEIEDGETF